MRSRGVLPPTLSHAVHMLLPALLLSSLVADLPSAGSPPNVLVILADDLGIDMLAAYGVGLDLPVTPNLDALAQGGLVFDNAWANPFCSPSRAALLTGRYGFRTGIGNVINATTSSLPLAETTLPELLDLGNSGWAHAAIGKWHLSNEFDPDSAPNDAGFAHFDGTLKSNLGEMPGVSYYAFPRVTNGVKQSFVGYNTAFTVNSALDWIVTKTDPWFCYVSFNTPHSPFHAPPTGTYSENLTGLDPGLTPRPFYKAMIENMDFEIGRLLTGLGAARQNTLVLFLGDNGTPGLVVHEPFSRMRAKGTPYEGGVHVPLVVSGPLVTSPGQRCAALVDPTDLFATVAGIAGLDPAALLPDTTLDGISFLPYLSNPGLASLRGFAYAERFTPVGTVGYGGLEAERAVRDQRYKLIARDTLAGAEFAPSGAYLSLKPGFLRTFELYDLSVDPLETTNLLCSRPLSGPEKRAFSRLLMRIDALLTSESTN